MRRREPELLVIETPRQMRAFSSPLRIRMFEAITRRGPLTVREIAEAIGRPPSAIYQHIEVLRQAGFIHEAGVTGQGRRRSLRYAAAARGVKAATGALTPSRRKALARLASAHARHALRSFTQAVEEGTARLDGPQRNAVVRHLILSASPDELEALNADIDTFVTRWAAPLTKDAPQISLAIVMGPPHHWKAGT
jgi:DNA-binding transcriptional ArsR family regulator